MAALLLACLPVNVSFGKTVADDSELELDADISGSVGNQAETDSAVVGADVEMTGITVINGSVWIDGVKMHKPQSVYTSKRSGKTYRIYWGENGNVSVVEE